MKTTTKRGATKTNSSVAMLESMLAMTQQNMKGSQGSERLRLVEQESGIREQLRTLGQVGIRVSI